MNKHRSPSPRTSRLVALLVCSGCALSAHAQTAAQLQARFATLLGPNRYVRMVWQRESENTGGCNPDQYWIASPASNVKNRNQIMYMDSKDGIVKVLKDETAGKRWTYVTFSCDGRHILYMDVMNHETRIMDGDGTNDKQFIASGYWELCRPWQSADKTQQYVVMTKADLNTGSCQVYRVNVNNASDASLVADRSQFSGAWGNPTDDNTGVGWGSLTPDGQYLIGGFSLFGELGIAQLTSKTVTKLTMNGCWISASRAGSNRCLWTADTASLAHLVIRVADMSQKPVLNRNVSSILPAGCVFETLRWTADTNFVTFSSVDPNGKIYSAKNPYLVNFTGTQLAYATVDDANTHPEGNSDVFFYDATETVRGVSHPGKMAIGGDATNGRFDVRGRELNRIVGEHAGVFLSVNPRGVTAKRSVVQR